MSYYDEYNKIIHEYFDIKDRDTRKTIISLDEAEQNQLLAALTSKLYDKIVEKVDDIDFGTLPRSRGDITKIENYTNLMECIDILRGIVAEYKEDTYPVDVVSSAVENLKTRKALFTKAYALNVEMPIVLYNTVALAIVASVSFLISGCIEYVKDPGAETFSIALDRVGYNKTAHNLLFENLANFNEACKKGDVDVAIEDVMRNNRRIGESADGVCDFGGAPVIIVTKSETEESPECVPGDPACAAADACEGPFHPDVPADAFEHDAVNDKAEYIDSEEVEEEANVASLAKLGVKAVGVASGVFVAGKALIAIAKLIIPFLQNLVYYFYQSKQDISDYFAIQAELVQMNAYKVQYNSDIDAAKRKDIYRKQMKTAENLKKISNKFAINYGKSSKAAANMIKDEKKKLKTSDLGIAAPASSALF